VIWEICKAILLIGAVSETLVLWRGPRKMPSTEERVRCLITASFYVIALY
jgi:hypothetical protein